MSKVAILVGSVYGGAEDLAENTYKRLTKAGHSVNLYTDSDLNDVLASESDIWLVVTSTTGQGDVPANLETLYFELKDTQPNLSGKQYAVIAMGDSSYGETFCQAGRHFDEALSKALARPIQPLLEIDACETMDAVTASEDWLEALSDNLK